MTRSLGLVAISLALASGCGKPSDPAATTPAVAPSKPPEAASQLQQAFSSAPVEVKQSAEVASEALRTANYEQAVQALQGMRMRSGLTPEQGMAVYSSQRSLEASLIAAMQAGDPNAKRAYELLKKSRKN
jgi:hypothetical protein